MGAKRRGSAGSGLDTGSRLPGPGSEASAIKKKKQSSAMARTRQGRCSKRPVGAKAAVTQGSVQMAGGGGWCRRWQWLRAAARQAQ